ncbi:FAD-dependent thymidylate synthase [Tepidanaerobacter syntrophicus]|uniref:FAD-dependent thymidylate synthase n=1 Tax=Tepidanaerobacter syntrophicus TaxID=224999 RepID=UPI001BD27732|nr:FAD-dependent thymidylate synthase [Tepidanaerobacter syntrophicus]
MKVTVLSHTPEPERTVAAAARLCYSNTEAWEIMENLTPEKASAFIKKLIDMGHMSPMEHASFTFAIDGVSRSLLSQITRHRIASYSVQSLRYNNPFDKELSSKGADRTLEMETKSYMEGIAFALKNSDITKEVYKSLVAKNNAEGHMPQDIKDLNMSSYMRGIFDGAGTLSENNKFAVAFPKEFDSVLKGAFFEGLQKDGKILIEDDLARKFIKYIYEDMDFANSSYDEEKFLESCLKSPSFAREVTVLMETCVDKKYYATVPESISRDPRTLLTYIKGLDACKKRYIDLIKSGIDQEDARYILPLGTQTKLVMTMNVRSLHNFFNLRCCERAQTEIRNLAYMMLEEVKKIAPSLFETAGAPCEKLGYCPEGKFGCGKYPPLKSN